MLDKVTRQLPQTPQPFWRERRAEAVLNLGPSGYQPNALLLGQTGSLHKPGKFFYSCSIAESHCTTPSSGIDQDNRCPLFQMLFLRLRLYLPIQRIAFLFRMHRTTAANYFVDTVLHWHAGQTGTVFARAYATRIRLVCSKRVAVIFFSSICRPTWRPGDLFLLQTQHHKIFQWNYSLAGVNLFHFEKAGKRCSECGSSPARVKESLRTD